MQYRLAWFKTDSYQSRIYAYENNVLYGYSFPSFMGEGWRTYLNLSWKPLNGLTCYLKGGFTVYPDREVIGSGVTKVEGINCMILLCSYVLPFEIIYSGLFLACNKCMISSSVNFFTFVMIIFSCKKLPY